MKLEFLGGAQTVTGSKSLLTIGRHRILIDCGLFQGLKEHRLKNWLPFPISPKEVEAVLVTHAHLDHTGALPLLVREGFKGPIYASQPTIELSEVILKDSGKLQEEDADFANRRGYSKHSPAEPLYTVEDARHAMTRFQAIPRGKWRETPGRIRFRMTPSSHILGSTFVEVEAGSSRIVFSGDLGRANPLLYPPPAQIREADYLVLESTYGDRLHPNRSALAELAAMVTETHAKGGHLIIPSFAVGRAQELLYLFHLLRQKRKIPKLPIYLDSPMGEAATRIFVENGNWHRLDPDEAEEVCKTAIHITQQSQSISVMNSEEPSIVIAGSGMLSGGRVLHHLEHRLPDARNTVLLVGFQAPGSRGRLLLDGADEIKMHGKYIPVRASVREITDLSAHADQSEIIHWLKGFTKAPKTVFINHGEPQAADALRVKITDTLGWQCVVAKESETYFLETQKAVNYATHHLD